MRIAIVHTQALDSYEAGVAFVTGAASGLAQAGAQVTLLTPGGRDNPSAILPQLGVPDPHAFQVVKLPRIQFKFGPLHPSWSARFHKAAIRKIKNGKFEAVIVRDLRLAQALCFSDLPAKIIYEAHNIYTLGQEDPEAVRLFSPQKLRMHRARIEQEAEVLMAADGVIALTEGLKKRLEPMFGLAGRIISAGSALHPTEKLEIEVERNNIAYIGSLDPHKGVGMVVEALRTLPGQIRLLLIGHGRHRGALDEMAAQLGLTERLDYIGWTPPAELPKVLASCFAAVVPLEDCFYNRYVTSPMKLFDYARAGVVPVAPKLPVFAELFPNEIGAVMIENSSPNNFAAALSRLFEDAPWRKQKEAELARFAAAHTWQARGKKLLPFLADLTKRPKI